MTITAAPEAIREAEFLERIATLVPGIRARANMTEELRHLPDETIAELKQAGMFRLHTPAQFGGLQLGLHAHVEAARMLATACVSTAWTASFLSMSAGSAAKRSAESRDQMIDDDGNVLACGSNQYHQGATLTPVDGGYRLTGRWSFCTGVHHARFVHVSLPREQREGEAEDRVTVLMARDEITVHDVWHTSGMRGTGSNDISVEDLFVPEHHVIDHAVRASANDEAARLFEDFSFLRYPAHAVIWTAHPAYVVGAAERAVEIFRDEIVPRRFRPWGTGRLIDSPLLHRRFGEAAHLVRVARLLLDDQLKMVTETNDGGGQLTYAQRAYMNMAGTGAIESAGEAITLLARASGGGMHRSGSELDRIQRDVEVLHNHSSGDWEFHAEYAGRVLLGLGLGDRPEAFF